MGDLTIRSFAYLRIPLLVAGMATLIGALGAFFKKREHAFGAVAGMMVLFFVAAKLALVAFDPYLGSYPLAKVIEHSPKGGLIVDNPYYEFSSVFFYTNRTALILNGRKNNLEYGSYAPGAPQVFIDDNGFVARWRAGELWYVVSEDVKVGHLKNLVGESNLHVIMRSGGKAVYANQVVSAASVPSSLSSHVR
jgi:hypothetical protein